LSFGILIFPEFSLFSVFALMAVVLIVRPWGLVRAADPMSIPLNPPIDPAGLPMVRRVPWTLVIFLVLLALPWVGSRYDAFLGTET